MAHPQSGSDVFILAVAVGIKHGYAPYRVNSSRCRHDLQDSDINDWLSGAATTRSKQLGQSFLRLRADHHRRNVGRFYLSTLHMHAYTLRVGGGGVDEISLGDCRRPLTPSDAEFSHVDWLHATIDHRSIIAILRAKTIRTPIDDR